MDAYKGNILERQKIVLLGSSLRVASLAATTVVGFLLMPFVVHRLGDQSYGYWVLVGAVLGYYGVLDLGIVTAVQFQVAKALGDGDPDSANRTISTAFYTFAGLGTVVFLITVVIASLSRFLIPTAADVSTFRTVLLIAGVDCAVGFPGRAFAGALSAHLRYDLTSSVGILVLILRTALVVVIVGAGGGIVALALITFLTDGVGFVLNYFVLCKIQENLQISIRLATWRTIRELFHYSKFALVVQVSDQLRFSVDGWMVGVFVGVSAVTHYGVAARLSQAFLALIIAVVGILSPWFSQLLGGSDFDGIRRVFELGTKVSAVISTIVALSLVLYGHVFVEKWMGPRYLDAYWPLVILVAGIFCDVSQLPSVSYMYGVSRHRFLACLTLAEGVSNLGLSIYWARHYGMIGVALGSLVPMAIAKLFIQPAYVCRHLEIPIARYYLKLLGRSIIVPAASSVLCWALFFRKAHFASIEAVCLTIVGQALVCAVLAFFLSFDRGERHSVLSRIPTLRQPQLQPIKSSNS
ncbi:MAG: oligosaccharide flippase family protein [Candidatus Sulfotelmatobacter sp.]